MLVRLARIKEHTVVSGMVEAPLLTLLAKLKEDSEFREKLIGAADLDAAVAIASDAGFDLNKADWLNFQARHGLEMSDEALSGVTGGTFEHHPTHYTYKPRR